MGEQLDLFGGTSVPPAKPLGTESEQTPVDAGSEPLPGQMDLFGDRWLRAAAAHRALETFDLEAASKALREMMRSYPSDPTLQERAVLVERLGARLRKVRRQESSAARALAAISPDVPSFLAKEWNRCLAEWMEVEAGSGATLDGVPAGLRWLRAGDPPRAETSLRATLERNASDGRARGYLAEALFAQNRQHESRLLYRDALAESPAEVDLTCTADIAVRDLPGLAEEEFELPGAAIEWAAAVGLIEGVFIPPANVPSDWLATATLAALPPGVQFYRWLVAEKAAEDHAARVACRRAMKALNARLLKEVLDRKA